MQCPLCRNKADSPHHIVPRAEGGEDDFRNIVYLCKRCHNEIEGLLFTPALVEQKRLEHLGKAETSGEEYHYLCHTDYMIFVGVWENNECILPTNIYIPVNTTIPLVCVKPSAFTNTAQAKKEKGRPRKDIPMEFIKGLWNKHYNLRQIIKEAKTEYGINVSDETIRQRIKGMNENFIGIIK